MFGLMPCREDELNEVYAGYLKTNSPLVSYTTKSNLHLKVFADGFYPQGTHDDVGIYLFMPKIAKLLSIEPTMAFKLFSLLIVTLGFAIFAFSIYKLIKNPFHRTISTFFLCIITFIFCLKGDVYITSYLAVALFCPLLFLKFNHANYFSFLYIFLAIIICVFLNLFRSNSGTMFFILALPWLILKSHLNKLSKTAICILSLVALSYFPKIITSKYYNQRDAFFISKYNYKPDRNVNHVIWHPLYIGLGYFSDGTIKYEDSFSIEKAKSINPNVVLYSTEYESILKREYFNYVHNKTMIAFSNYFLKFLVCILPLALCLWFLYFKIGFKIRDSSTAIFMAAMFFGFAPSIIAVPRLNYYSPAILVLFCFALYTLSQQNDKNKSLTQLSAII